MRKFGCNILAVIQQYDVLKASEVRGAVLGNSKMFLELKSSSSLDLFALVGSTRWHKLASDSGDADPPRPSSSGFPLPCALDRADDAFIAQQFRHLASRDFLSQPFDDGGLSNPCFS